MPLIGANGGLLGSRRTTSLGGAVGVWTPNEQVVLQRSSSWPINGDPNTGLLLHFEGSNGSTTFADSGIYGCTVVTTGGSAISTAAFKFGSASLNLDGSSMLNVTDKAELRPGSGDFTYEMWMKVTGGSVRFFRKGGYAGSGTGVEIYADSGGGDMKVIVGGSGGYNVYTATSSGSWSNNTWQHLALVRSGSTIQLYQDGISRLSFTDSSNISTTDNLYIGGSNVESKYLTGYVDEFRFSKVARYTSNFTPPTEAFAA